MESQLQTIEIENLIRDERLRFRCSWSHFGEDAEEHVIERYKEAFTDYGGWGLFPAVTVVRLTKDCTLDAIQTDREQRIGVKKKRETYKSGSLVLVGGFTRCISALAAGLTEVQATVSDATWEDAVKMAWVENARHDGRKRTAAELRDVIASIESANPGISMQDVARLAGCHKSAVWRAHEAARTEETVAPVDACDPGEAMKGGRVSATQGPQVVKDLWGRPLLTPKLQEQFGCVPAVLTKTKKITALMADIAKLKNGPDGTEKCVQPGMASVEVTKAYATVTDALESITGFIPWIVCPECDAENLFCERCAGRGWITQIQANDLPAKLEKKARKWMTDRSKD